MADTLESLFRQTRGEIPDNTYLHRKRCIAVCAAALIETVFHGDQSTHAYCLAMATSYAAAAFSDDSTYEGKVCRRLALAYCGE